MRSSNYLKGKKRISKKTILIYGEGLHEEVFLKYIYGHYGNNSKSFIKIKSGTGGSADQLIKESAKTIGEYNERIVLLDNDKSQEEMNKAREMAKSKRIKIVENTPCLEAILLEILIPGKNFASKTSKYCKHQFQLKFVKQEDRSELKHYRKFFPKSLLDIKRKKLDELNNLISLVEL